jgi:hypothetical protein
MLVEIGAKTHNFTDPTGLLSDCHRRIEMFMGTLKAVAAVIDRPPAEDTVRALESASAKLRQSTLLTRKCHCFPGCVRWAFLKSTLPSLN